MQNVTFIIKVIKRFWKKITGLSELKVWVWCHLFRLLQERILRFTFIYKRDLYLHKHEKVIDITLRFWLSTFFVTNITSTLNKIQAFIDHLMMISGKPRRYQRWCILIKIKFDQHYPHCEKKNLRENDPDIHCSIWDVPEGSFRFF